jgi:hypothetical protein
MRALRIATPLSRDECVIMGILGSSGAAMEEGVSSPDGMSGRLYP